MYPLEKQTIIIFLLAIEAKKKTKYHLWSLPDPMTSINSTGNKVKCNAYEKNNLGKIILSQFFTFKQ